MKLRRHTFLFFCLFLFSNTVWALSELDFEYGLSRQVYGTDRENKLVSKSYSGSWAFYLFQYTALEFNYNYSEDTNTVSSDIQIDSDYSISGSKNVVETNVYGIGLRQSLASRNASIRPLISLGYAKQFVRDRTEYTIKNTTTGTSSIYTEDADKRRTDTVFAGFSLQLKLTKFLSLKGSVKTIFKAFETDKARDNVKYLVGFSWML